MDNMSSAYAEFEEEDALLMRKMDDIFRNEVVKRGALEYYVPSLVEGEVLEKCGYYSGSVVKTVQTGLLYFTDEFGTKNWGAIFASVSICVIPMLIMYLFLNKRVIEGMTAGSTKG